MCLITSLPEIDRSVLYLQILWRLWLQSGSCPLGLQRTSWLRPWLLSLSLQHPNIGLSRPQWELLFNTLCLSRTPVSLHVPAGLTQTKPAKGPWQTGIPTMSHAQVHSRLSRFYASWNQRSPNKSQQKRTMWGRCIKDEISQNKLTGEKKFGEMINQCRWFLFLYFFIYRGFACLA